MLFDQYQIMGKLIMDDSFVKFLAYSLVLPLSVFLAKRCLTALYPLENERHEGLVLGNICFLLNKNSTGQYEYCHILYQYCNKTDLFCNCKAFMFPQYIPSIQMIL